MLWALVNESGLNEGVMTMDARSAAAHPLRPGYQLREITREEHRALKFLGHAARHQPGVGWHLLPEAHVRAWTRARGADWETSLEEHKRHTETLTALEESGMLAGLRACPDDLPAPPPCVRLFPVPAVEVRPDLWIREMTEQEAGDFADQLVVSGLYAESPEQTRARAAIWHDDPKCWPIVVTWRGQPLSYESYHFDRPGIARVGFNVRLRRDRTYRFWREVFTPLFQALLAAGITTLESRAVNAPGYVDGLIEAYGAMKISGDDKWANLMYDLARTVAKSQGFPTPKTAGPTWSFQTDTLVVREAASDELAGLHDVVAGLWRNLPGSAMALQILDDWLALDGATALLGLRDGVVRHVRVIRERRPGISSFATVTPFLPLDEVVAMVSAELAWHRAVGYEKATSFITPAAQVSQRMQDVLTAWGAMPVATRQGLDEVESVL